MGIRTLDVGKGPTTALNRHRVPPEPSFHPEFRSQIVVVRGSFQYRRRQQGVFTEVLIAEGAPGHRLPVIVAW